MMFVRKLPQQSHDRSFHFECFSLAVFSSASEVRKKEQPKCKCKYNTKQTMVVQNVKYTLEFCLLFGHFHLGVQKLELTYSMRTIFKTVFCHFLYRAPDCLVTFFSAGATTFCERSRWRDHHIAPPHKCCYFCCI